MRPLRCPKPRQGIAHEVRFTEMSGVMDFERPEAQRLPSERPFDAKGTRLNGHALEWGDLETVEKIVEAFPMPVAVLDEIGGPLLLSDSFRRRYGVEEIGRAHV